ncbi:MAG: molybdate ABC transporter permease subunit [Clostridia bacterium]|nr:molybdate ABC transporter permease subunit [Clostridia bacterium]
MLEPVILSLKVAVLAVMIVFVLGLLLARLMARHEFPGQDVLEALLTLPLVLPPSVVGYGLLVLFGVHGPLGKLAETLFGARIVFTWWAAVLAATVVSFPLMYQSAKAAISGVDLNLERAARTLGAGEWRIFATVTLPLAWPGIVAGLVLAFARALGEFGATLMIAGNIPGQTQTIPLAIYFAVESGDTATAQTLGGIMAMFSFTVIFGLNYWTKWRKLRQEGRG